jgi:nicotinamide mononucleotide transporter
MESLFSVNSIAFTVLGYPMSYIEFVGTVFYLWSVWLISQRNVLTWPIGIISVLLFMVLFYQIQLYSDTIEQVYYLGASAYGWWVWQQSPKDGTSVSDMQYSTWKSVIVWVIGTALVALLFGYQMTSIHLVLPVLFPEPASFPYLDALTTIMSFTAMWLMAQKRIESWIYWIIVDVIGIWLYFVKDVRFLSLLYVILLVMAVNGLRTWHNSQQQPQNA